ncbi:MAG: DinB family protein [Acidobacteriia bacterium]|nr:DinB family protein [Terriglobia bacterium]
MTANEARRHLAYSTWASRRILEAALAIPEEQRERDLGTSHKGVMHTLHHIVMADRNWLYRVLGEAPPAAGLIEEEWPHLWKQWEEAAASWSDADLERVVEYRDLKGNAHRSRLDEIVLHVVNHATLHRGQVMGMLRQLSVAPPATDLIFYYRQGG